MEQMIQRCPGSDVHKAVGVARVRVPDGHGGRTRHTEEVQRPHQTLEDAGIKLATVATDVIGGLWAVLLANAHDRG